VDPLSSDKPAPAPASVASDPLSGSVLDPLNAAAALADPLNAAAAFADPLNATATLSDPLSSVIASHAHATSPTKARTAIAGDKSALLRQRLTSLLLSDASNPDCRCRAMRRTPWTTRLCHGPLRRGLSCPSTQRRPSSTSPWCVPGSLVCWRPHLLWRTHRCGCLWPMTYCDRAYRASCQTRTTSKVRPRERTALVSWLVLIQTLAPTWHNGRSSCG